MNNKPKCKCEQLPYHEKFEEDCKCKCHQETKEVKEEFVCPECKYSSTHGLTHYVKCSLRNERPTPNKNIEGWEKDFYNLPSVNFLNRERHDDTPIEEIKDFIAQTLSEQREQICKEIEGLRVNIENYDDIAKSFARHTNVVLDEVINLINN